MIGMGENHPEALNRIFSPVALVRPTPLPTGTGQQATETGLCSRCRKRLPTCGPYESEIVGSRYCPSAGKVLRVCASCAW